MTHKKLNSLLIIAVLLLLNACQKDDITTNVTVKGNVRNNCTGKGFANVEVQFLIKQGGVNTILTTTDANGNFSFSGIDIHSSSKYSYALNIETHSYYDYNFYGIGPIEIDKNQITNFNQFGVSASFKLCTFYLPTGTLITPPDTFTVKLEQRILHSYEPNRIWAGNVTPGSFLTGNPNFGNYPMGLWHITLDKTKGGVHSIVYDSIYLDMGATANYNVPW